ncbi:MAG: hypothetical protein ACFE9T_09580 [Promethearchaeota archaeon]
MGFKEIFILKEKEKRVYLLLVISLIVASIFFQFEMTRWRGIELFNWILCTCMIYFCFNFILRDKISKYNYFIFPLSYILSVLLVFFLAYSDIGYIVDAILLLFAIYYWFAITAIFMMNKVFNLTVKIDFKVEKWPKVLNYFIRGGLFIGGALFSTLLLNIVARFIMNYGVHSSELRFIIWPLNFFMIIYIWFFFIIGCISLFFKKSYLWFGFFFILSSFYAIYIMVQGARWSYSINSSANILPLQWGLFIVNSYLLLSTTADLVGKKSKFLTEKLKIVKSESMIIGLIFSMSMVEFMSAAAPEDMTTLKLYFLADFFPIFFGLFGIYTIYSFTKKTKVTKEQKKVEEMVLFNEKKAPLVEKRAPLEEEEIIFKNREKDSNFQT